MPSDLDQLLHDVADFTGVAPPTWLAADAPVLAQPEPFYLVGLIGGKDVGKSALVNALVGHNITLQTSFGPGTETVIAYAHNSQTASLKQLLESEVPGRYRIVEHDVAYLTRQVLLDLPDIDSHWGDHVAVTRKMLRHMLFPAWVQSVEKYADRQPQDLLLRVAAGNAPENFVFCLNKVDQLIASRGAANSDAVKELQDDYAARLQRLLKLASPPRVWAIAAVQPDRFEFPIFRGLLAQQKTEDAVRTSRASAAARQKDSVLVWLDQQDLPGRAARLQRLEEEIDDAINERLATPLLDGLLPNLLDDPSYRNALIDECLAKRVSHWPIVNVLHPLFAGIGAFLRRNTEEKSRPLAMPTGETRVDQQLADLSNDGSAARSLAERIQTTFALLQQTNPSLSELYRQRKLWDAVPASEAASDLRDQLIATVNRQRAAACGSPARSGSLASLWRGLLTLGAIIWFPFLQPIIHMIQVNWTTAQPSEHRNIAGVLVDLLSLQNFLQSLTGLLLYFLVLWLILRWLTQHRVWRQINQWKKTDAAEPDLSLTRQIVDWLDGLIQPLRQKHHQAEELSQRISRFHQ